MSRTSSLLAWGERTEEDYAIARSALRRKKPLVYPAYFHAQQCAEIYLKAILISKSLPFPKTHDLLMPSTLCDEAGILIPIEAKELNALNDY
jgi:HEPN domain-containing protein